MVDQNSALEPNRGMAQTHQRVTPSGLTPHHAHYGLRDVGASSGLRQLQDDAHVRTPPAIGPL
jgi:hypothetical protein